MLAAGVGYLVVAGSPIGGEDLRAVEDSTVLSGNTRDLQSPCYNETLTGIVYLNTNYGQLVLGSSLQEDMLPRVVSGDLDPNIYFNELVELSDKLREASREGDLSRVIVDPSKRTIEDEVREIYRSIPSASEEQVYAFVRAEVEHTFKGGKLQGPVIFPAHSALYGISVPRIIAVPESYIYNDIICNDDEMITLLEHGLMKIRDSNDTISYADGTIKITRKDLINGRVSWPYIDALMEVRAGYSDLDNIFRSVIGMSSRVFTPQFTNTAGWSYMGNIESLEAVTNFPKERNFSTIHEIEMTGITITPISDNLVTLEIDRYGRNETFNLIK